ncbi:MAG TPA: hypothetical protein VJ841_03455 [Candidatus Saccharimonadales bacterium]|nr:hypothetical protein [Candidatus Saccharimonadales bacterium]
MKATLKYNDQEIEVDISEEEIEKLRVKETIYDVDWQPGHGQQYWTASSYGYIHAHTFENDSTDYLAYELGNFYPTREAIQHALEVKKAEMRIKRAATLKNPDWGDGEQRKYIIYYDYQRDILYTIYDFYVSNKAIAYYATLQDAEKAIKEQEEDYLLVFGIKK